MLLIDTSVWISVFRDRTGQVRQPDLDLLGMKCRGDRFRDRESKLESGLYVMDTITQSNYNC